MASVIGSGSTRKRATRTATRIPRDDERLPPMTLEYRGVFIVLLTSNLNLQFEARTNADFSQKLSQFFQRLFQHLFQRLHEHRRYK